MGFTTEQVIIFLVIVPEIAAAVVGAVKWKHLPANLRPLALLTFFALLTELVSRVYWLLHVSNLFMWPIYIGVEFALLVWMYSLIIKNNVLLKFRWVVVATMIGMLTIEEIGRLGQPDNVDNIGRSVESVLVIGLVLLYYYTSFKEMRVLYIWKDPVFWISTALLIFFAGNFLIYTFANFSIKYSQQLSYQIWALHGVLTMLLYSTYAYGLWISPRK
ncbi:hypothetical protein [Hymenobacter mucosus]|uniref:Uncharacterized protein n=1 Tax=Hymenobacter mucosus TaxID=1411120 RepID=A0A238Y242_9BACT|nr:hypothetical protein [Hymenobacter mucosus]SNR64723.1 hypothetical protein SAMN06269173_104549 [Hymenobacter mucosus]